MGQGDISNAELRHDRDDIFVDDQRDWVTLTLIIRNRLVTRIALVLGVIGFANLLGVMNYFVSANQLIPGIAAFVLGVLALIWAWKLGWRRKAYPIVFLPDALHAGDHKIAYDQIEAFGQSRHGGDTVDGVNTSFARNYTPGAHLYVKTDGRHLPLSVGMTDDQARAANRIFVALMDRFASAGK